MGKPQSGFRLGNFAWLGSYSECMNLTEAQYCLAGVKITIPPGNQVSVLWLISMLITYRSAFDLFNPQFHVKSKCGTNPVHHQNLLALRRLDGILISGEIFRACTSSLVVFVTAGPFLNRNLLYIQLYTRLY